jgi:hypothetical protein
VHKGIFFTEADLPGEDCGRVSVTINRQNADLAEVKERLARSASQRGANAVTVFSYGQKKHSAAKLMNPFVWDSESWFGEGQAKRVPP